MRSRRLDIALLFLLIWTACKREITVDIPDRKIVPVIDAELNPDSLIKVHISETQKITDNSDAPVVDNAVVDVLDHDSVWLSSLTYTGKGNYQALLLKPQTGKRYLIRVLYKGVMHWADETMPDSFQLTYLPTDTSRIIFQGKKNFFQVKLRIKDLPGSNYYGLKMKRVFKKWTGNDTITNEEWVNMESLDFILTENPETRFSKKHILFRDDYFKGLNQLFAFGTADLFGRANQKTLRLEIFVSSYSEKAYLYYTSVNEHLLYQNDPFSQPTHILGNVSDAYGAVSGNFTRKVVIQFPQ